MSSLVLYCSVTVHIYWWESIIVGYFYKMVFFVNSKLVSFEDIQTKCYDSKFECTCIKVNVSLQLLPREKLQQELNGHHLVVLILKDSKGY